MTHNLPEDGPTTRWKRFKDNDVVWSFINSPGAMIAAAVTVFKVAPLMEALSCSAITREVMFWVP